MKVLIACETSGMVREAFRERGHDAWSADLLHSDDLSPYHIQGDVLQVLDRGWDLMIAHAPCTYLAVSGMHWTIRGYRDPAKTEAALEFVKALMGAPIDCIAIENPVSIISTRIRRPPHSHLSPLHSILTPYPKRHHPGTAPFPHPLTISRPQNLNASNADFRPHTYIKTP